MIYYLSSQPVCFVYQYTSMRKLSLVKKAYIAIEVKIEVQIVTESYVHDS